jgi:tetratricopeptide (TPR) repeat protein
MGAPQQRQAPAQRSAKNHPHPWYNLRHPFRLFYLLLAATVAAEAIDIITNFVNNGKPQNIWLWNFAAGKYAIIFWPSFGLVLIVAGIGWWFDTHPGNPDPTHIPLPLARDLRAVSFKMGDDVAAEMPFIVSPIQEVYLRAVNILHDAAARAPSAKNGLIVLGVANAGKTRLAFEVVKKVLPTWRVLIWRPDDPQPSIGQLEDQDVLIFVDDLQEHAPRLVRYSAGAVQSLDTRALDLRKMEQLVRSHARRVILVATCRSEDEVQARAYLGWLFAEVDTVTVPVFPMQGPLAEQVIHEFQQQALKRTTDWDGTMGSLVLGLSTKRQSYAELAADRDPAVRVLQAMKLLSLAGIETHTAARLQTICSQVFRQSDLAKDEVWQDAVEKLTRMQFVTEGPKDEVLIIRKDTFFEQVITDYPSPNRPQQLERDLEKASHALSAVADLEGVFHVGNTLYRMKQYEPALSAYDFLLGSVDRTSVLPTAVVWRNKGAVLQSLHRYEAALAAYERAIALDAKFASAWRNRAGVLGEMGRSAEALTAYDQALAVDPNYAQAWNGKGKTLARMGRSDEALAAFEKAISLDPHYDFAWRNKGDALSSLGRRGEALAAYDKALEITPTYAYAWNGKGVVMRELGQLPGALEAFDQAIALDPRLHYAFNGRGATLRDMGRLDEALAALDQCLAMKSSYASAWKNRGTVLNGLGRYDEALSAFDRALAIDAEYCPALTGRGVALAALGRYGEALTDFNLALAIDPNYLLALEGKSGALRSLGEIAEADAVDRQREALTPQDQIAEKVDAPEEEREKELVPEAARPQQPTRE